MIWRLLADRRGATSIEYAVIACLISITIVAGATGIGTRVNDLFLQVVSGFR